MTTEDEVLIPETAGSDLNILETKIVEHIKEFENKHALRVSEIIFSKRLGAGEGLSIHTRRVMRGDRDRV